MKVSTGAVIFGCVALAIGNYTGELSTFGNIFVTFICTLGWYQTAEQERKDEERWEKERRERLASK